MSNNHSKLIARRKFLFGLGATLAVIRTPGLLMSIKPLDEITIVSFKQFELVAFENRIPAIGIEIIEGYLAYKYEIAESLPIKHPYRWKPA